jgi:hypothetical protein
VRSAGVVVDPPFFDDLAGLVEVGEQVVCTEKPIRVDGVTESPKLAE